MTSNQIAYAKVQEEAYANRNAEEIKRESNRLQSESNAIAYMNALTNQRMAEIRQREAETNILLASARQAEEARHNREMESVQNAQLWHDTAKRKQEATLTYYKEEQANKRAKSSNLTGIFGKILPTVAAAGATLLGI